MQFLRTLFWVIVAVAMLIFAVQNNGVVTVNLWGGLQADVKLWLLALGPFVLGFVPTWIVGRINLWRQRKQASAAAQRALERTMYEPQPVEGVVPTTPGGAGPGGTVSISVSPPTHAAT